MCEPITAGITGWLSSVFSGGAASGAMAAGAKAVASGVGAAGATSTAGSLLSAGLEGLKNLPWGAIGAGAEGLGGLMQIAGINQQYKEQAAATSAMASYNMQRAQNEMALQRQLSQQELQKGEADKSRQARDAARQMGAMRAAMGAGGFELDSGSNLSLLGESAKEAQYDNYIIGQNAAQSAWQHDLAAANAQTDYNFYNFQKKNAKSGRKASLLDMGTTLLGTVGKGISMYHDWTQSEAR